MPRPKSGRPPGRNASRSCACSSPRRRRAVEQCLALEGDIQLDDVVLSPGDYSRNDAFSDHGRIHTRGGCLLLIISSSRDELPA
ncbi:MAG TPA: hypothetical protein VFA33_08190 [Bryobacteraceae bacterium]|nr:hypothetical protein [Bryobacteraceae bacterium]